MNVLAPSAIIFDAIKEKTHALAERTELQGDKARKQFRAKRSHGEG
jgi:hypothetical protein